MHADCNTSMHKEHRPWLVYPELLALGVRLRVELFKPALPANPHTSLCISATFVRPGARSSVHREWRCIIMAQQTYSPAYFSKRLSFASGRKESHLMLGRAWEPLKCTWFTVPLASSQLFQRLATDQPQFEPFTVRSDATRWLTPLTSRRGIPLSVCVKPSTVPE